MSVEFGPRTLSAFIESLSRFILVIYLVFISCIYLLYVILCRVVFSYCYVSFLNVVRIFRYYVFDFSYLQLFFVFKSYFFLFRTCVYSYVKCH